MTLATRILSATLGRVAPKYRTLGQWAETYRQIIDGRPIEEKTKANRRCSLTRVLDGLGSDRIISAIRPHEVASMIQRIHVDQPQAAKRVLIECKDVFSEAINYGWIDRNPATPVKCQVVKVQQRRLTLEQWLDIHAYAKAKLPPWVSRMMVLALVTGQRRSDLAKMRFDDVWDDHLHVEQAKTGARLALPLSLKLNAIGVTLGEAIDDCRKYSAGKEFMIRKHDGEPLVLASLSARFEEAREMALIKRKSDVGIPASLHECRSLSERLYRAQGIDTMTLLGHKHQSMTDMYNDDRGLSRGEWKTLTV